jgi:NhaP-type Na+/H+ or K+/H+ antiporter
MLLLFTFVLLGSSLIWTGLTVISVPTLLFTAIAVLIRTPVYFLALKGSHVETRGCLLIAWFGPRGLSSLLLVLLPVFAGLPGSEELFTICSLVVLASVVIHGGSPLLLARAARRRALKEAAEAGEAELARPFGPGPAVPENSSVAVGGSQDKQAMVTAPTTVSTASTDGAAACELNTGSKSVEVGSQYITLEELQRLWQADEPVTILDVRKERTLEGSDTQAKGAVRMPPDHVAERAKELGLNKEAWLIAYCA